MFIEKNIDSFSLNKKCNIKEAMEIISANQRGGVVIVDDYGLLVGFLSDGDIRRALLKDVTMISPVDKIMNVNFVFSDKSQENKWAEILEEHPEITMLPIVDKENKLLEIVFKQ